ncbi:MAG: thermonuclease family protein [Sphaerochaetaceae bacterium]
MPKKRVVFFFLFFVVSLLSAQTVFVTPTGTKYHNSWCPTIKQTATELSLVQAGERFYEPCQICQPPVANTKKLYRVNVEELSFSQEADITKMRQATVVRVVDGDTVRVVFGREQEEHIVRLIGIDTPETVHPSKPVEYFGQQASEFTKSRLQNQTVFVAFDWDIRDKYGRLLAYLYLPDGTCFNALIIQKGYAYAYMRFPFQFSAEFARYQKEAQQHFRGLWADTPDKNGSSAEQF